MIINKEDIKLETDDKRRHIVRLLLKAYCENQNIKFNPLDFFERIIVNKNITYLHHGDINPICKITENKESFNIEWCDNDNNKQ